MIYIILRIRSESTNLFTCFKNLNDENMNHTLSKKWIDGNDIDNNNYNHSL